MSMVSDEFCKWVAMTMINELIHVSTFPKNHILPWIPPVFQFKDTDKPLYTDTRYNDKIGYNANLTVTKHSLKR